MSMNFDTYSTSFQSLMGPMYNLQANYNANMYGNGAGYGSYGASAMGMGGFIDPLMSNTGVGQFNADALVRGDDRQNNYYARPIPVHKKKDDLPAILGIVGATLGTIALLAAMTKGRGKTKVVKEIQEVVKKETQKVSTGVPKYLDPNSANKTFKDQILAGINDLKPGKNTPVVPDLSKSGTLPSYAPKYIAKDAAKYDPIAAMTSKDGILNGINNIKPAQTPGPIVPDLSKSGTLPGFAPQYIAKDAAKYDPIAAMTSKNGILNGINNIKPAEVKVNPIVDAVETAEIKGLLPAHVPTKMERAIQKQQAAMNLPSSGQVFTTPYNANQIQSQLALPQHTKRYADALVKQEAAMNLPSSGQVFTTPHNANQIQSQLALPQHTKRYADALAKQEAAMNLPSSGKVFTTPYGVTATAQGKFTPEAQQAYNRIAHSGVDYRTSRQEMYEQLFPARVARKGNKYPKVTGDMLNSRLNQFGLELNGREFAKLNDYHKLINNTILNGTEKEIRNLTADPRFQSAFQISYC